MDGKTVNSKGHVTRYSDSSLYDERCIHCGGTDASGDGRLDKRCLGSNPKPQCTCDTSCHLLCGWSGNCKCGCDKCS